MGLTKPRAYQIFDIDYKQSVRVITLTNVTLSGGAPSSVDGVNLSAGDRILVAGQSTGSQNGLYQVSVLGTGSDGTWIRSVDGNETGEIDAGMIVMVTEGEAYKDTQWKLITNDPIIIGTTALVFEQNSAFAFGNIYANGTAVLANTVGDTVTFSAGDNIAITGNATAKSVTIAVTGISLNSISNGTSNVTVVSSGGNVTVGVNGNQIAEFSPVGIDITGNLIPTANITYDLGNATNRWNDIWLANSTVYLGNAQISANATSLILTTPEGAQVVLSGSSAEISASTVTATGNITGGNLITSGILSVTGNATANNFIGNLSGTANVANWIYVTESADPNESFNIPYLSPFGAANAARQVFSDDGGITFNPSTNLLTTGALTVNTIQIEIGIDLRDSDYVRFGTSDDASFFYDGTNNTMELELESAAVSFIITDNGTTRHTFAKTGAYTATGNITAPNLLPASDNTGVVGTAALTWSNGQFTNLTIDNTLTVATINVSTAVDLADDDILRFGTSDDWELYHTAGGDNRMDLNTGNLVIRDDGTAGDPTRFTFGRTTGDFIATGNITGGNIMADTAVDLADSVELRFGSSDDVEFYFTGLFNRFVTNLANTVIAWEIYANNGSSLIFSLSQSGNLQATGNIQGANVISNALVSASTVTATGNITGGNLTTTGLISAATLSTTGNATIGGNLTVQGNLIYVNVEDLRVEDPVIIMGTGPNGDPLTSDDGQDRGIYMEYYTTGLGNAFVGWQNSSGNLIAASHVSFSANNIISVTEYGTLQAGNLYVQSVDSIGNITGSNITTAGEVIATGNVTGANLSLTGNVVSALNVTGNVTSDNLITSGLVSATGNVTGDVLKATGNIEIQNRGILYLNDSDNSNYIGLRSPATLTGNFVYIFPANYGNADQVLSTNGAGGLSWVDQGGGGGGGGATSYPNSTVQPVPGSTGNFDLSFNFVQTVQEIPFEATSTDPFGVNLGEVYSMMDPVGEVLEGVDLGVLT